MSHYEERLEHDLQHIRQEVAGLAKLVEQAVKNAVHALMTGNEELASQTILADGHINRAMRAIDGLCHSFIAVHLPSAGHLRLMSAIFRTNILLERIGDYAVTICREMFQLSAPPSGSAARGVELMGQEASTILGQAVQAFEEGNVELARGTMAMASQVQATFDGVFQALLEAADEVPLRDKFATFVVYHRLERIADQAKNLCEEAVFAATGETKAGKVYRILFIDKDGAALAPMARAIAGKRFPASGDYTAAACSAVPRFQPNVAEYLQGKGVELGDETPSTLDLTPAELGEFHVIVGLNGAAQLAIPKHPFHTVVLQWDIPPVAEDAGPYAVESAYRELAVRIKDLMVDLRGEDAA